MATATHFDQVAATWDESPTRRALTAAIAAGIRRRVPLHPGLAVLEYGCGTAALSLLLSPWVGPITAADTSAGMLAQAQRKLTAAGVNTITAIRLDLAQEPLPALRVDLVAAAMVLHHVDATRNLLTACRDLLRPGGWVALADLHPEDGSFHTDVAVPHRGFDPAALGAVLTELGFVETGWETVHVITKQAREYPVFLLTARLGTPTA